MISSSCRCIKSFAFYACYHLSKVEFDDKSELQSIGEYSFSSTPIEKIEIPSTVINIGKRCFYGCYKLASVFFQNESKLKEIKQATFAFSSIGHVIIPSNVQHVSEFAFISCHNLKTIEFLGNEITIDRLCFDNCYSLSLISFPNAKKIIIDKELFIHSSGELTLFISAGSDVEIVLNMIYDDSKK